MLTFAFTCLSFTLLAAAGFFIYRSAKQELTTALKAHLVHSRKQLKAMGETIKNQAENIEALRESVNTLSGKDIDTGFSPSMNFKEKLEKRYGALNQEVILNDETAKVGAK